LVQERRDHRHLAVMVIVIAAAVFTQPVPSYTDVTSF